ncbi:zf-HC2 domain-containing protein [Advenella sp. WQ 585]|uniref:Zf-HC2 domain-containing protein n=1 Tax=Advenella mandrilli TaxID=2800330 RepID=A0ABS1EFF2_9BURK|nr:zf-HC2 domain-containing protein [Advenella mandrilli]MBK1781365.1 zf-HC2 domain-containing protein [Advenella mandrilli]
MHKQCPRNTALSAFLDQALSGQEKAELQDHLHRCPICSGQFAQLQQLHVAFQEIPKPVLNFDLANVLEGRLQASRQIKTLPPPGRTLHTLLDRLMGGLWLPAGSAAMALTLGLVFGGQLYNAPPQEPVKMMAMNVFDSIPPGNICAGTPLCNTGS